MKVTGLMIMICQVCLPVVVFAAPDPNQTHLSVTEETEKLWRQVQLQRVAAMESNQSDGADTLKRLVSQVQSLEMSANPTQASEPNVSERLQEKKTKVIEATQAFMAIPKTQSGNKVENGVLLTASLDEVQNPVNAIATADVLYQAKDFDRALRFYQMLTETEEKDDSIDRQWAMFQAANCLRHMDAAKAVAAYQRLIADYPNSAWTPAALAQQRNLEWFKQNQTILSKSESSNETSRK